MRIFLCVVFSSLLVGCRTSVAHGEKNTVEASQLPCLFKTVRLPRLPWLIGKPAVDPRTVLVEIHSNGMLTIANAKMDARVFAAILHKVSQDEAIPTMSIWVGCDESTSYTTMLPWLNVLYTNGIQRIRIAVCDHDQTVMNALPIRLCMASEEATLTHESSLESTEAGKKGRIIVVKGGWRKQSNKVPAGPSGSVNAFDELLREEALGDMPIIQVAEDARYCDIAETLVRLWMVGARNSVLEIQ